MCGANLANNMAIPSNEWPQNDAKMTIEFTTNF